MDHDDGARSSTKEIPVYSWHNKQEGKEEYAKFSKEFSIHIKQLRYLLDPAAVTRRLGPAPAPNPPANAVLRKEWREDRIRYENRLIKIDSDFAEALSALERSFLFASPPRHIIDKTIENRPADVEDVDWNYERKFRACWEALRAEYQPSTAVDLSQLRDQIFALSDQAPGGFDTFRSEFHRLHAEIVATRVPEGIRDSELNGIVRDGIRNPVVWAFICHPIYSANPNAPWSATFDAVSTLLTSFRQKGMDPYADTQSAPLTGHTLASANAASTPNPSGRRSELGKRQLSTPRDSTHKFQRGHQKSVKFAPRTSENPKKEEGRSPKKCTRCWNVSNHDYRSCQETRCACGKPLANGQLICFNYDNHPPSAQFPEKIPPALASVLDAYKRGKAANAPSGISSSQPPNKTRSQPPRGNNSKKSAKAMAAHLLQELTRQGVVGSNLDSSA